MGFALALADLARCYELGATPAAILEADKATARLIREHARLFVEISRSLERDGVWTNDPALQRRLLSRP